ncbi:hypothetical protein QVD17_17323 [Tagetes erecta]|uniref:Uncharacterized protein n=1 Tax=Tagetes erecta TaxID=13708 RepID=A0AAD8KT02_TARER|nr:hypothetical protein QVD17_17323 [Tagetes erecta]
MADTLNNNTNLNFQLITYIILHDISFICSFITSYPLYFSYLIFFSRYFIKLISFISPLFIATIFLSLILTTTTATTNALPQLKLSILQTLIYKLKSNLYEVNGDENDREFEDFEIYKTVFECTLAIDSVPICSEGDGEISLMKKKKILENSDLDELGIEKISENSDHGCRKNEDEISDTDKLGFEMTLENSVHGEWRNEASVNDVGTESLGFEKTPESYVHGSRRNEAEINGTVTDKICSEKIPENSVHGGRRNEAIVNGRDSDKLIYEKSPEVSAHGGRSNEATNSDTLSFEKPPETSVHGGRGNEARNYVTLGFEKSPEVSVNGGRRNEATTTSYDALGFEKTPETSVHGGRTNEATNNDTLGFEKIPVNSVHDGWRNEAKITDAGSGNLGIEKTPENSVHGGGRNVTDTDKYSNLKIDVTATDLDELKRRKSYEKLLEQLNRFEEFTVKIESKPDSEKVTSELLKHETGPVRRVCSLQEAIDHSSDDNDIFSRNSVRSSSWRSNSSSIVNGYELVNEKEWRKTLACKLFEERHNSRGGEEGMDSLWEGFECDYSKSRNEIVMKKKNNNNNEGIFSDEDEDEEMSNGHLCCLQALKFSTRKMNLGMGKPNIVKIAKAMKGFGWLHHVKKNKKIS